MLTWVIAGHTLREVTRQPALYYLVLLFGLLILTSPLYTAFGFGGEWMLMREAGLATVALCGLLTAVLASSRLVHREIESGTAQLVLSKPVRPYEFLIGKFLGIAGVLLGVTLLLGLILILTVALTEGTWDLQLWKGVMAAYFEVLILSGLALAFSVHLPFTPNAVLCGTIFVLGQLSFVTDGSSLGWLGLTLLPDFTHFQAVQEAVTIRAPVPAGYLLLAGLYGVMYTTAVLLLGVFLLSRREIV